MTLLVNRQELLSLSDSNRYVTVIKPLKTVGFSD